MKVLNGSRLSIHIKYFIFISIIKSLLLSQNQDFESFAKEQDSLWQSFSQKIDQQWEEFKVSNVDSKVDYNKDYTARSEINFRYRYLEIEAIVSETDPNQFVTANRLIGDRLSTIFDIKDQAGNKILAGLLMNKFTGNTLRAKEQGDYLKQMKSRITESEPSYQADDGAHRRKYSLKIPFTPKYLQILINYYLIYVKKYASQYNIDPQLVLAIIHHESSFNPWANNKKSNASGLMQLVPKTGALDAYNHVFKTFWTPSREYLEDPEKNIQLGVAYLDLLENKYFKEIKDPIKKLYVTIAAYNWGPTNVRKKIVSPVKINEITQNELFKRIKKLSPASTGEYLSNVISEIEYYNRYF